MEILFSHHAKRRAKLYGIPQELVVRILTESTLTEGKQEIVRAVSGFSYPLKVVVSVETGRTIVITNYPLKREKEEK